MTRPEIIRADSIDLQNHHSPSAQDHTRQPTHLSPLGVGPHAPHQAEALREAAAESAEQIVRSPRVSKEWTTGDVQQLQQYEDVEVAAAISSKLAGPNLQKQDNLAIAQNGGLPGSTEDAEMADAEGDDGMDDDMMDKISSSPSIDDGGYFLPHIWPQRSDSSSQPFTPSRVSSFSQACGEVSPTYVQTPGHFPSQMILEPGLKDTTSNFHSLQQVYQRQQQQHHHHPGEYTDTRPGSGHAEERAYVPEASPFENQEIYDDDFELQYAHNDYEGPQLARDYVERGDPTIEDNEEGLMILYENSDEDYDDDDDYATFCANSSRYIDFGWNIECLQDLEDIDFEFVYALHTFVATVEGQANATKGDTMVLLDDSNSYWWLVRVVKDSSIGYLPAEHIETPTERLARLNKHRNIDLTSTMLGDQAEKPKNPLKKTIRRRNAKKVTFTAPTYVEASDIDYSTEEEEEAEGDFYGQNGQREQEGEQQEARAEEVDSAAVEPLKPRAELREVKATPTESEAVRGEPNGLGNSEVARASEEISESRLESKSRNGTVRNTDSFFKDDTVETRKITLTPNLLRDDSSTSTAPSIDTKELKQRASLDKLEKELVPDKKRDKKERKDKKEKDKKPGMLSGLFKRKEKKSSAQEDENEDSMSGKRSTENSRSSPVPSKDSEELVSPEEQAATQIPEVHRQHSKLQKQPRGEMSPNRRPGRDTRTPENQQTSAPDRAAPTEPLQAPSMRWVQSDASTEPIQQTREASPARTKGTISAQTPSQEPKSGESISKILRSVNSHSSDPKVERTKKAKARVELDDFDSSPDISPAEEPLQVPSKQSQRPIPGSFPDSYMSAQPSERSITAEDRLSESPVHISPITTSSQSHPPALMVDTSSQEEPSSPTSSPSPELIDAEDARKKGPGSSTSTTTSTWSDAHLRTFFDDDADIKDLLVVVYDKSGVVPAGPDHPIVGNLFREENAKLADITHRLDGMLGDWLARKMRTQASR